jgi:RNA polymerase sigma-B factor
MTITAGDATLGGMDDPELRRERRLFARLSDPADPVNAEAVFVRYRPLARHCAGRFRETGEPFEDLLQVAEVGLLQAIRRFDPARGCRFTAYATPTVLGELTRHLRDATWFVHVPRDLQDLALRVERMARALTVESGRSPTADVLADALGCTVEDVVEGRIALRAQRATSLQAPAGDPVDGDMTLLDTVGADDPELLGIVERGELDAVLRTTPHGHREIIRLRYDMDLTQAEIGRRVGVSQMQVSRVLTEAGRRLEEAWAADAA